jgi:hypothetical protein
LRLLDFLRDPAFFRVAIASSRKQVCVERSDCPRRESTMRQQ